MKEITVSVVIPVYNEERRIKKTLSRLSGYLKRQTYTHEIIVVEDGSLDGTRKIAETCAAGYPDLRIIRHQINHGKGFAVREGILESHGEFIFFTDADLSTPPWEISRFVRLFQKEDADILIGSRSLPASQIKIQQPIYRRLMGKLFNLLVRCLTPLRFWDTQCGFKAFRAEAARQIFPHAEQTGFVFDVEVLLLAKKFDFRTKEVPVQWINHSNSKVGMVKDSFRMFRGLLVLRRQFKDKPFLP